MRAPPPARRGAHRDEHHCSARGSECDVTDDDDWKSGNITKGMISSEEGSLFSDSRVLAAAGAN